MRFRGVPLLALLVMSASMGCAKVIDIKVAGTLDGNGRLVQVKIDQTYHDSVFVQPGDRVVFACQCPPGAEFTVEELHFVADLHDLVERLRGAVISDPIEVETVSQALQSVQVEFERRRQDPAGIRPQAAPQEKAGELAGPLTKGRLRFLGPFGDALLVLPDQRVRAPGELPRVLFSKSEVPWEGPGPDVFVAAGKRIKSPRVDKGVGEEVWKFTWRVRVKGMPQGTPGAEDSMDPHIFTSPDLKG